MYLAVADAVLSGSCASYQLNLAQVMDRGPGSDRQILHRDEDVWIHMPRPHPELQFASVIALVDFTKENGATIVVPGSHRWARERQPLDAELAFAEMPAGSAVLYLGSTLHLGGYLATVELQILFNSWPGDLSDHPSPNVRSHRAMPLVEGLPLRRLSLEGGIALAAPANAHVIAFADHAGGPAHAVIGFVTFSSCCRNSVGLRPILFLPS